MDSLVSYKNKRRYVVASSAATIFVMFVHRSMAAIRKMEQTDGHTATMMNELKNKTCKYFKLREWGMEYF